MYFVHCRSTQCESRETIESDVVAIDPNSGLTSLTINEEVDLDDDDDYMMMVMIIMLL